MGDHAIAEARIALENVRASARAFADAIAEVRAHDGSVASTEIALLRRAELPALEGDTMKALGALTRAATELLRHGRPLFADHPQLALASRRLESDLCIASAVLQTVTRERSSSPPQAPQRKLG